MIPLVLIPGMMCDARLWQPQMPALARHPVLHAPCCDAETIAEMAARVLRDAPPRFALAGLSMGGIVAMQIMAQASDRVLKLALLDTNALAETTAMQARRQPQIDRVRNGNLAAVMRDEMIAHYLAEGPDTAQIRDLCMDMALGLGPDVFARQSRALATRPDHSAALSAYRRPALVLMGAQDRLCPPDRHALMHRLMPHSRLAVIAGAGHLPTLEKPMETTAELLRWLEE